MIVERNVQRVQTGMRIEQRLLEVLNRIAEESGRNLGALIEEMVLHSFEGEGACAFADPKRYEVLLAEMGLDYGVHGHHGFIGDEDGAIPSTEPVEPVKITRRQAGFRIEKRLLKVLKGCAEYSDGTLGQTLEDIALHQLAGADAFMPSYITRVIEPLKKIYGLDDPADDRGRLVEPSGEPG